MSVEQHKLTHSTTLAVRHVHLTQEKFAEARTLGSDHSKAEDEP